MTVSSEDELAGLKRIGRIVAETLEAMGRAIEPGMTTLELDRIGRGLLEAAGARPAPELLYAFPGATCISVDEEIAHGIPGPRRIAPGDLVFWSEDGTQSGIYHVAMYLGDDQMIEAPTFGMTVRVTSMRYSGIMPYAVRL